MTKQKRMKKNISISPERLEELRRATFIASLPVRQLALRVQSSLIKK